MYICVCVCVHGTTLSFFHTATHRVFLGRSNCFQSSLVAVCCSILKQTSASVAAQQHSLCSPDPSDQNSVTDFFFLPSPLPISSSPCLSLSLLPFPPRCAFCFVTAHHVLLRMLSEATVPRRCFLGSIQICFPFNPLLSSLAFQCF